MILLIVGDFGVGKDTFADMLLKHLGEDANKILSYTTRNPRYDGENTHFFVSEEEWKSIPNVIAETKIDGNFYGTVAEQFGTKMYDIYVVDDVGVQNVIESNIGEVFIIEVVRPKWLIDLPDNRLNRARNDFYFYTPDYCVINDGSLEKLDSIAQDVCSWLSTQIYEIE